MPADGEASSDPVRPLADPQFNSVVRWLPVHGDPVDGPLTGVRVGVKDNIAVRGVPTTCASDFFVDDTAKDDAAVVTALRDAGAEISATLNMAELAIGVTSQNSVHGATLNPWDIRRVPGGSSGGSAAAVAAGLVDVALGTDTGGSIRLPASACGVIGLRPTPGTIDLRGIVPVSSAFDTVGPLACSLDLVEAVHDVLRRDPAPAVRAPTRIGVPVRFVTDDIDPGVRAAVGRCVAVLGELGFELVPISVPADEAAQHAVYALVYAELVDAHRERITHAPGRFQPETLARLRLGLRLDPEDLVAARALRDDFRAGLTRVFNDIDLIVTPTLPVDVPLLADDGDALERTRRLGQLSYPWSLHDGPTLSIPVGLHDESRMPIGAQITAPAGHESSLFAAARAYQAVTQWHDLRPHMSR
ncbi:amidase [Aeromicrobium sp.]|uniref:amidase n=1 Tax=Aeromicrobium sp. TaxID=1871063 RepID=UPI0019C12E60|nr:amidase [Aeromicrobium sp.]MBC7630897.1 amidase [Aeromicrobium sp.]